jgi:zinc transporter
MKPDSPGGPLLDDSPPGALVHRLANQTMALGERTKFEWLHFCARHDGIVSILHDQCDIPLFIAQAMVAQETRSRAIVRPEGIMVLIKAMHQHDGANPEMMVSLRLWIEPERIVSAREHDIDALLTIRNEIKEGCGPASTADLMIDMIGHAYDEFDPLIDAMEAEIDNLEELVDREETEAVCSRLSSLERRAAIFHRHLAPQSAIFKLIAANQSAIFNDDDRDHLNELDSRLRGILETLRDMRERALIIDQRIQRIEEFRQTKANLVFAVAATLFLPATFLTGLFGVNVGGIPWLNEPMGFVFLSTICLVLILVSYATIRRSRWL